MTFAFDVNAVADSLRRPLTDADRLAAVLWAQEAAVLIKSRLGDLAALDQGVLQVVIRWAVLEQFRHPEAAIEVTTSVDNASSTRKYEKSTGHVVIRDEWWAMLTPATGDDNPGAFSIRPSSTRDPMTVHRLWHHRAW